jgi:hypothetical protein
MGRPIDPSGERSSAKFSMEGRKPAYPGHGVRHAHWSENALATIEQGGKIAGAIGTAWQIGRGVVQAGRVLGPLLAVA